MDQFSVQNDDTHVIDMDAVGEATFEVYPKGWHNGTVIEHSYELSQNSGAPMWVLKLEFDADSNELTGESSPLAGKKIQYYMSFSPKAIPFTKKVINTVWPGLLEDPEWKTNGKFDLKKVGDASLFVGTKVSFLIKHAQYEGQPRANIAQIKRNDTNAFMTA